MRAFIDINNSIDAKALQATVTNITTIFEAAHTYRVSDANVSVALDIIRTSVQSAPVSISNNNLVYNEP